MPGRDIVVIGGSTGALEVLQAIVVDLPRDLPAAIFVAIHISPGAPGVLDRILSHRRGLPATYATDRERIETGRIYLAPPDRHLLVMRGHVRVTEGPRENRFRPAIDPLFRTAAEAYGERVIAVLLSGGRDDGAIGVRDVKRRHGVAVVQDPGEAVAPGMPQAAMRISKIDHVLATREIAGVIAGLVGEPVSAASARPTPSGARADSAIAGSDGIHQAGALGTPSPFTCPDCGGVLWSNGEGELGGYHCHLGHRLSAESLRRAQDGAVERALWAALRSLEESSELNRRMAHQARQRGLKAIARDAADRARERERHAQVIRHLLMPAGTPRRGPGRRRPSAGRRAAPRPTKP